MGLVACFIEKYSSINSSMLYLFVFYNRLSRIGGVLLKILPVKTFRQGGFSFGEFLYAKLLYFHSYRFVQGYLFPWGDFG